MAYFVCFSLLDSGHFDTDDIDGVREMVEGM
jgi:hypothetical protein